MPTLTIDQVAVPFEPGETILQAATRAGIAIPALCHYPGIVPPTSCYVCVVKIQGKGALAPSCATPAEEGMVVESGTEEVRRYRRRAIELLMSEHAGDCEAPCTRICPADLDIPALARHIAAGDWAAAACAVRERLPLPGVLGHVCTAPCEKGCVRAQADGAVSIRDMHRRVAEAEAASGSWAAPRPGPATGKRVAIIGAGPAGLSCAYYLSLLGHACTVIDEREEPGGMLRYGVDRAVLPLSVLEREVGVIRALGVEFRMAGRVGDAASFDGVARAFDAVIVASGNPSADRPCAFDVQAGAKGIVVATGTFATSRGGVYACGGAIAVCRLAARAVGQGREAAMSVHGFLTGGGARAEPSPRFDSRLGKLEPEELKALMATDLASYGVAGDQPDRLPATLIAAAGRCLQCDCGKKRTCALRAYAREYEVNRDQYRTGARKHVARTSFAGGLVHEPGKCVDCGRCVGIAAAEKIRPGLAFGNRGFDVAVKTPFGVDLETAMGGTLDRCVEACPVGALWNWKRVDEARGREA